MLGLRMMVCGNETEVRLVTDYLKGAGRKYVISDKTDVSELKYAGSEFITVIYYEGDSLDQAKLVDLTAGTSLYSK